MSWVDDYKSKLITAEEAVSVIQSGDRVYISGNAATPYALMSALASRKDKLEDVELVHVLLMGEDPLSRPGMEGHFRHNSLFVGPADRKAINEGRADYVPIFLHQIPNLFYSEQMPLDVALLHLSPPDEHGFMSLGVEVLASKAAAETAKIVIAQVNEKMPRILGDSFIHVSRVNKIVEVSEELPQLERKPFTEVERKIGHFIADLIEDGSTLQLGIGGIPDAVLSALKGRQNLGIHTEMVSDGVMEAIEEGIITGAKKTFHPYKVIFTFLLGSKKLYDFVDNNPMFEAHPTDYTNHPFNVSRNDNMVAVNSAIEVDITGQVCSDSIGTYIYSGFGGQVDFIRGAAHSKGGKPVIALPSTAKKNELSRIVPFLKKGAGIVTTRADVKYVVTEYGVAYLHGKNLQERTIALINIAHPKFREDLTKEAKGRYLLP
ncbi:MAG: acetyl-CoA hydrolase/transferase family protein [Candidatus Aminicenantes bacterium]|nr:acetyl-CoA hydrolase/transferase family protein [Candidatus Aminicenantes bacterium]MBL7082497.1 acetyl-CoA hydrolase/transferase family protein [Candidatus Aminicenantes bacterium]